MTGPDEQRPLLRVVKGDPTPEEIAALVAVITARQAASAAVRTPRPRSAWGHPARAVRPAVRPGPGGWRASALSGCRGLTAGIDPAPLATTPEAVAEATIAACPVFRRLPI